MQREFVANRFVYLGGDPKQKGGGGVGGGGRERERERDLAGKVALPTSGRRSFCLRSET